MITIDISDWLTVIMWFVVVGAIILVKNIVWSKPLSKFLFPAYLIKVFGGIAFVLVYHYYYGGGDTSYYFMGANKLSDIFFDSPNHYFKLLFSTAAEAQEILHQLDHNIIYARGDEGWFMVRLISPITIIGIKSILGTTFFLSMFSLIGSWKLFKLMNRIIPNKKRVNFAINFLVPSVIFWGSGIMKDTITMASFFILVCWFYELLYDKKNKLLKIGLSLLFLYVIYHLKAYILIGALPWVFITLFLFLSSKLPSLFLKVTIIPFLLITIAFSAYFVSNVVIESSAEYNTDNLINNIEGFHSWHTTLGGSAYTLGEMEYTFWGILAKTPAAINVTLFRPYIWESNSAFVLLSALESLIVLGLTLWTIIKSRLRPFRFLFKSPFMFGGFVFCMVFSFAIGLTAYNFGALVRFKIPMLSIYLFSLFYVLTKVKEYRNASKN